MCRKYDERSNELSQAKYCFKILQCFNLWIRHKKPLCSIPCGSASFRNKKYHRKRQIWNDRYGHKFTKNNTQICVVLCSNLFNASYKVDTAQRQNGGNQSGKMLRSRYSLNRARYELKDERSKGGTLFHNYSTNGY